MTYHFNTVVDGLSKYINSEILGNMNDLQEIVARIAIGRVLENRDKIKDVLSSNGVVMTLGIIDSDGLVDVDTLFCEVKREIERKGKLTLSIPMFGKLTFNPTDVDTIKYYITGERQ
jgi:hypothetical protein